MNHVSKAIFVTLMLTLALSSSFGQHIISLSIDPNNDTLLTLSDGGTTEVRRRDSVSWVINDARIVSFAVRRKNARTNNIFTTDPEGSQRPRLGVKVAYWILLFGGKWEYSVVWTNNANQTYTYDPKIAVRPIVRPLALISSVGGIVLLLIAVVLYRRSQRVK